MVLSVMVDYYSGSLSAERLELCYEVAPPRVRRYLTAEIERVAMTIDPGAAVLELGCGYGRVLAELIGRAAKVVGIDTSAESLELARTRLGDCGECSVLEMDATELEFPDGSFDVVICIQNGISAFGVDRLRLFREAIRVTRAGGRVLFSSYAAKFWGHRLEWFRIQAEHGLIGPIDEEATGDGVIVCEDGFRATTVGGEEFAALAKECGLVPVITEVDGSSLFCELSVS